MSRKKITWNKRKASSWPLRLIFFLVRTLWHDGHKVHKARDYDIIVAYAKSFMR